jgi:hypothetical protein
MSACSDVTKDCQVDMGRIGMMGFNGAECAIDPGKIGDLGSSKIITPYGVTYYRPGISIREFNHGDLRLPQKREFLGPEFFNSGCATLYGNSRFNQGPNSATTDSKSTTAMYDFVFSSSPYFEGNHASCYDAGVKCAGPNSALGWMMDPAGTLLWQSANQLSFNCGSM